MRKIVLAVSAAALIAGASLQGASATVAFAPGVRLECPRNPSTVLCPARQGRTEPAIRVDYTTGQAWLTDQYGIGVGVAGGINLWRRAAGQTAFTYHDKVDGVPVATDRRGYALGGGDSDLTIGDDGTVYAASLWGGYVSFAAYEPDGDLIHRSYTAGGKPNLDRHWIASHGNDTVYLYHWDLSGPRNVWVARSDNGGITWGPPISAVDRNRMLSFNIQDIGNVIVDPRDGTVFTLFSSGGTLYLARCAPAAGGCSDATLGSAPHFENFRVWTRTNAPGTPQTSEYGTLFPVVAVDRAGNLFAVWSDRNNVWFTRSTDRGETWSTPIAVNDPVTSRSAVFPWIVAGSEGRVGIAWLGSTRANPELTAGDPWYAYYTQSIDALTASPTFTTVQASDDAVHNHDVCLRGLACDTTDPGNRNLAEVVTIAIDVDGYALVAYPDDYEQGTNGIWRDVPTLSVVAEQIAGDTLFAPGDFPA